MVIYSVTKRDLTAIGVVNTYRRIRERLGDEEVVDFDRVLIAETAEATSMSPERVQAIVSEWIEARPLRYLRSCLFSGVPQLFAGLKRSGRKSVSFRITQRRRSWLRWVCRLIMWSRPAMSGCLSLIRWAPVAHGHRRCYGRRHPVYRRPRRSRRCCGPKGRSRTLIRSSKPIEAFQTFGTFHDPLFDPFMQ